MSFGNGYTPVESLILANGDYRVRIIRVEQKRYTNGNEYISVVVEVSGKKGYSPNTITLNERPVLGTMKGNGTPITDDDCRRWDRTMTTFFDSFKIQRGNFIISSWVGAIGNVHVNWQYDGKELDHLSKRFKEMKPFKGDESVPNNVQAVASAFNTQAPVQQPTQAPQSFPEDIPF